MRGNRFKGEKQLSKDAILFKQFIILLVCLFRCTRVNHSVTLLLTSLKLNRTTLVTSRAHGLSNSIFGISTHSLYLWKMWVKKQISDKNGHGFCNTCLLMQEMQLISLGQKDPLEEGKATLSSILAWQATVHRVAESWTQTKWQHAACRVRKHRWNKLIYIAI